ncbi:MAG: hypothetical protein HQM08_17555 [Candidatus Riflebacteria bacterium]|nr:hypothetical protein [Candidatus Riflebacteria bacterium]
MKIRISHRANQDKRDEQNFLLIHGLSSRYAWIFFAILFLSTNLNAESLFQSTPDSAKISLKQGFTGVASKKFSILSQNDTVQASSVPNSAANFSANSKSPDPFDKMDSDRKNFFQTASNSASGFPDTKKSLNGSGTFPLGNAASDNSQSNKPKTRFKRVARVFQYGLSALVSKANYWWSRIRPGAGRRSEEQSSQSISATVGKEPEISQAAQPYSGSAAKESSTIGSLAIGSSTGGSSVASHSSSTASKFPFDIDEGEKGKDECKINVSGTKTFELKQAQVKGDIGHFSSENFSSIPGFRLDQSLHLEVDGNINKNTKVNAILDDKQDQDRRFTVFIDGPQWNFTLGDFKVSMRDTEFVLYDKEIRGIMAVGKPHPKWETMFLFSQSKGVARREQFRGAGQQQEFRLLGRPVVQNSENIFVDGRILNRGTDYIVDYEEGIVKLQPHLLPIEMTSWIVVEYEVTDVSMAFKRNLYGGRVVYKPREGDHIGFSVLREVDATTPKSSDTATSTIPGLISNITSGIASAAIATTASGTASTTASVTPMDHFILAGDAAWRLNHTFSVAGEYSLSIFDPNTESKNSSADQKVYGSAAKFGFLGKNEKLEGEYIFRQVDKDFKLIGRQGGVTQLGERGLVQDIRRQNGRFNYKWDKELSFFGGLEQSETNLSHDPALSNVNFFDRNGGVTFKGSDKSQFEFRWDRQTDKEVASYPVSDRDKDQGTLVLDHEFGHFFFQNKIERVAYNDRDNLASNSQALQFMSTLSSDHWKKFTWATTFSNLTLHDGLSHNQLRSLVNNYTIDANFDPNRVFNARGILQWRNEKDYLVKTTQDDQIADARIRFQPNADFNSQLKYKVENTTKVTRDPSIDPAKYVVPPSLPLQPQNQEEVVERFENPVQKKTLNFSTSYRLGEKGEALFDLKKRDLKDRTKQALLSFNDRYTYELRYFPIKQMKLTAEYEDGVAKNYITPSQLKDSSKRLEAKNEIWEGYIFTARWEDHVEDDLLACANNKDTASKILEFNRVFSQYASLELGLQRNIISYRDPSKEWEERIALTITPSAKSQRYKAFLLNRQISSAVSGTHFEAGLDFSQFIGADTIIDGEVKRVKSSATTTAAGYEATVANAKMVITF